ncbi:hypothetical protein IP84_08930 [beta proteobacterium AAP99]|nr:hypothetical protein IP84_08930 [beta proteobacterium AAP99]
MTTTSLKLPDELKTQISEVAQGQNLSSHAFMVKAIEDAVSRAKLKAAWLAQGEQRLDAAQRTGKSVAADEVFAWMRERGAGRAAAAPKARKA